MIHKEIQYLLAAVQFFTRIPVPTSTAHDAQSLNHALKYFPLVGWLVGAACALAFQLANAWWPLTVAVVISTVVGVLLTGALHEDGFADSCDGFGGGSDKPRILEIMQDPRIGNFAAIGLVLILLLKITVLLGLAEQGEKQLIIALLFAHAASRLLVLPLPCWLDYARADGDSKSRGMVGERFSNGMLGYAALFVLLPLLLLQLAPLWYALLSGALVTLVAGLYFKRRLGGYSGDCLGATQQVTELVIYLSLLATWT